MSNAAPKFSFTPGEKETSQDSQQAEVAKKKIDKMSLEELKGYLSEVKREEDKLQQQELQEQAKDKQENDKIVNFLGGGIVPKIVAGYKFITRDGSARKDLAELKAYAEAAVNKKMEATGLKIDAAVKEAATWAKGNKEVLKLETNSFEEWGPDESSPASKELWNKIIKNGELSENEIKEAIKRFTARVREKDLQYTTSKKSVMKKSGHEKTFDLETTAWIFTPKGAKVEGEVFN